MTFVPGPCSLSPGWPALPQASCERSAPTNSLKRCLLVKLCFPCHHTSTLQKFFNERPVVLGHGGLPRIVEIYRPCLPGPPLPLHPPGCKSERSARYILAQLLRQFLDLPTDVRPGIKPGKQDTPYLHTRITIPLDAANGFIELVKFPPWQKSRRSGYQNIRGTGKGVHRQHTPARAVCRS